MQNVQVGLGESTQLLKGQATPMALERAGVVELQEGDVGVVRKGSCDAWGRVVGGRRPGRHPGDGADGVRWHLCGRADRGRTFCLLLGLLPAGKGRNASNITVLS